jgi:hypothetical protein
MNQRFASNLLPFRDVIRFSVIVCETMNLGVRIFSSSGLADLGGAANVSVFLFAGLEGDCDESACQRQAHLRKMQIDSPQRGRPSDLYRSPSQTAARLR